MCSLIEEETTAALSVDSMSEQYHQDTFLISAAVTL